MVCIEYVQGWYNMLMSGKVNEETPQTEPVVTKKEEEEDLMIWAV